jgi:hypothetical protein
MLGLLAAADFSWAGAERGLLASRLEASPPPKNKFHGDGAPVRTQGLERGWLHLKRAALPPNRSPVHCEFMIFSLLSLIFFCLI